MVHVFNKKRHVYRSKSSHLHFNISLSLHVFSLLCPI